MTSPAYYLPSTADYDPYYIDTPDASQHHSTLNNNILVVSIVILFFAILFITSLHIFNQWALRRSGNTRNSTNRIHFFNQHRANSAARHNSGLSKAVIAQLPTFTYKTPATSQDVKDSESLECAVCLTEFQEEEKGRLLPSCQHSFHIECIDMWFYSHSTCPLCRAVVMPTITTSPLIPIAISTHGHQQGTEELDLQGAQNATEASSTPHESNPLNTTAIHAGHNAIHIPTNILFCGDAIQSIHSQVGSSESSEKQASSSLKSSRCMPHITIEIPARQDINLTSPDCISLPGRRSRCASPHQPACSSLKSLKSPGLRASVKRMLSIQSSKEKRTFSSFLGDAPSV